MQQTIQPSLPITLQSNIKFELWKNIVFLIVLIAIMVGLGYSREGAWIVFFLCCGFPIFRLISLRRRFAKGPLVILSPDGLRYLEGSYAKLPPIAWQDITALRDEHVNDGENFQRMEFLKGKCLVVAVRDPASYLQRVQDRACAKRMTEDRKNYGDDVIMRIDLKFVEGAADEVSTSIKRVLAQQIARQPFARDFGGR